MAKQNFEEKVGDLLKSLCQTECSLMKFSGESRGFAKINEQGSN